MIVLTEGYYPPPCEPRVVAAHDAPDAPGPRCVSVPADWCRGEWRWEWEWECKCERDCDVVRPDWDVERVGGLRYSDPSTTVAFESTVPSDSPLISALRDDARRAGVLGSLRPTQIGSTTAFPSYTLSEDSTVLSFPPLGKSIPLTVEKKEKEPPRRINPFMSLFGSASTTPAPSLRGTLSPERPLSPSPGGGSGVSSPRPSIVSLERVDSNASDALDGYAVTAYTISKPVRFTEVHKSLVKAVRSAVRTELDGLPDRILDKVLRFVLSSVCPVSGSAADQALLKSHHSLGPADSEGVPLDFSDPTVCGERLQDFIEAVYDDLVTYHRQASPSRKRKEGEDGDDDDKDAGEGTERVEALICRLLYNRIFSPLQSDDARHDEALSSRIAALNVLDLSLDHLGLITRPADEDEPGRIARGLGVLVEEIGEGEFGNDHLTAELQKLSTYSCLTPKQKADVLVHSHKLAVQGLAKLPPVMLRPEGEPYIPEKEDTLPRIVEQSEPSDRRVSLEDSPTLDASISTVVPETKSTSGADLILPLIIYAVVKANPAQLASQLMYLQRYRSAICLEGEASYAIVNLTAVVEFIEHVQLSELGLPDSQVISVEDLSPIGLTYLDTADAESIMSASSRLRGRVFQVGELAGSAAGSANKVITGVVDSLSSLRGYISEPTTRPRGSSGFSLASVTASVANIAAAATAARTRSRASSQGEYHDRELVQVASRPSSIKPGMYSDESEQEAEDEARSIRSVGSARDATKDKDKETPLGGRLTQMGFKASTPVEKDKGFFGFARQGRRSSTLTLGAIGRSPSGDVALATPTLPDSVSERFMTCQAGDIRMSEVSTLLAEYRRLVAEVERLQGERERG